MMYILIIYLLVWYVLINTVISQNGPKMAKFSNICPNFRQKKIEIKKSGSAMTSAISQLVYMPNFRAIGQSVWEKNGNRQTETQKDRNTHLNFMKIDNIK